MPRVVLAERLEPAVRVEHVMAARRDAVLVVGEPVHERLDDDTEHVARPYQLATGASGETAPPARPARTDDALDLLLVEHRLVGNVVHHGINVDMSCDVGEQTEASREQRHPSTVRMAAR